MARKRLLGLVLILSIVLFTFSGFSAPVSAAGRATFDTGSAVRSKWTTLAGSRDKVTSISQYKGDAVPEGVQTAIVSSSSSELPIYSWFDDGTIYYWSEDARPKLNRDASYMFNGFTKVTFFFV